MESHLETLTKTDLMEGSRRYFEFGSLEKLMTMSNLVYRIQESHECREPVQIRRFLVRHHDCTPSLNYRLPM